ncbi:hypothetical protein IJG22_03735 [Candidatus Saccharibacteria bacterium]|nr:hypothetical protein [Candidatus Saccharibacteria bacterium]
MIDIHSHILPGIDDGARTMDESIEIVQELVSQGVTGIVATPHYITDTYYVSDRKHNEALAARLREALSDAGIAVDIWLGNEIFIDRSIADLLQQNIVSTMGGTDYVLVEFSLNEEYPNYVDVLGDLMEKDYKVILAHPERYVLTQQDYDVLEELCDMGVLLQCNVGSFIGQYGKAAEKLAVRLARENRIFAMGSDIHHARGDKRIMRATKKLRKYYDAAGLERILVKNPSKMFGVI